MSFIKINGTDKAPASAPKDLNSFLVELSQDLGKTNEVISSILINGKELTEDEESRIRSLPIESLGLIEVFTATPKDLAYEMLDTLEVYMDRVIANIDRAAKLYEAKSLLTADNYFSKAIDGLDLFIQSIGGVKLAIRIGMDPRIQLIEADLVGVMKQLLETKQQANYVYLAELLQKDLIANLQEWKMSGFKIFREHATA